MNIEEKFRQETGKSIYADASKEMGFSTDYVNWLEKQLRLYDVVKSLKDKEETAFDLWLKNFKHAERDLYWYNKDTLYCVEAMRDIYNNEIKPSL